MNLVQRISAAALATAMLAGCGAKIGVPTSMAAAGAVSAQSVAASAQIKALITRAQQLKGFTQPEITERIHIYTELGKTNSDAATAFLLAELNVHWVSWPDAVEDALEPSILAALNELASQDVQQAAEDATAPEAKKKSHGRRFNIWDGIDKFFGVKRGHRKAAGGGPAPAPAPPAQAPDPAPAPAAGGDPAAGGGPAPAAG